MKVKFIQNKADLDGYKFTIGKEYYVKGIDPKGHYLVDDDEGLNTILLKSEVEVVEEDDVITNKDESYEQLKDQHYNNENGSLYLFAQQHNLNAYEFDCIKRLVRCRKKGQFKEDLEKTKRVIDLYLKEFEV